MRPPGQPPPTATARAAPGSAGGDAAESLFCYLLGDFAAWLGPMRLDERAFARRKARQLLKLLALQTDHRLHREQLLELLWPDLEPDAAANQLHKAVHQVRRAFASAQPATPVKELLSAGDELRLWAPGGVHTDVETFGTLARKALADRSPQLLERAVAEYRGDLLPGDLYEEWTVAPRAALQEQVTELHLTLGGCYLDENAWEAAEEQFTAALRHDPVRESAHRALLQLYARRGLRAQLEGQYRRYTEALRVELDERPSDEMAAFYRQQLELAATVPASSASAPSATPAAAPTRDRGRPTDLDRLPTLPTPPTPLIGRDDELKLLDIRLADPHCRLLTLLGPGGIGKTHLALEAARRHATAFEDGVIFVELTPSSQPSFLVTAIADALPLAPDPRLTPREQLLDSLRDRRMLLLLDNLEHLLEGAELLTELLYHAPGLKVLVTSRERLGLRGEWVVPLRGLAAPAEPITAADRGSPDRLALEPYPGPYPAIALFLYLARQVVPDFAPDAAELAAIGRITRLVEGMPLALELAASWLTLLSCREIAAELERNLALLAGSGRDLPERHRSIQAVFASSWRQLQPQQQQLLARLSVFGESFTRDAAVQVADADLETLLALTEKSLLRRSGERFSSHRLLRACAADQLAAEPAAAAQLQARHARYYAALLHAREDDLKAGDQRRALREIAAEFENVRLAWNWAFASPAADRADALDVVATSLEGVWLVCELRGWFQEGVDAFERVLAWPALHEQALHEQTPQEPGPQQQMTPQAALLRARAHARLGRCHYRLGRYPEALGELESALALLEPLDETRERAFAHNNLGLVATWLGRREAAAEQFQQALALYRHDDDRWGIANVLRNLGDLSAAGNDFDTAADYYRESLDRFRAINDLRGIGLAMTDLGEIYERQGQLDDAAQLLGASLAAAEELNDPLSVARALERLGGLMCALGRHEEAAQHLQRSLAQATALGHRPGIARVHQQLGALAQARGKPEEALPQLREAIRIFRSCGDRWGLADALSELGIALSTRDPSNPQQAREAWLEALSIARSLKATPLMLTLIARLAARAQTADAPPNAPDSQQLRRMLQFVAEHPNSPQSAREQARAALAAPPATSAAAGKHDERSPEGDRVPLTLDEIVSSWLEPASA